MDNKTNKPTYEELEAQVKQLAAESVGLKKTLTTIANSEEFHGDTVVCDFDTLVTAAWSALQTPATDAYLSQLRNEARAHDLNALISHYSAELDEHIKNGGEQFDEKSVRIRNIIVSARLFREQLREGKAGEDAQ